MTLLLAARRRSLPLHVGDDPWQQGRGCERHQACAGRCGGGVRRWSAVLSPWQASHCSRVRCSFPPIVIGPEGACGSSPSTTLRRPIASSIVIVERSSRDSIERAICLYFSGMQRKSFSTALSSSYVSSPNCTIFCNRVLRQRAKSRLHSTSALRLRSDPRGSRRRRTELLPTCGEPRAVPSSPRPTRRSWSW
jgi:hypothetical protein